MIKTTTFSPQLLSQHGYVFLGYPGPAAYFGSKEFYFAALEPHIILKNKIHNMRGNRKIPGLDLQPLKFLRH